MTINLKRNEEYVHSSKKKRETPKLYLPFHGVFFILGVLLMNWMKKA